MEPPPLGRYSPHSSKKRVFSGDGSSLMDEDVVEIPPPLSFSKSKSAKQRLKGKQKQVICHEVIDVDNDGDPEDLMIIEEKFAHKGKSSVNSYLSGLDVARTDSVNLSKGAGTISHSLSIGGESGYGTSYLDNYYSDLNNDAVIIDEECAMLQAHFDSIDVPPGVEAAVPWWPSSEGSTNQGVPASSSDFMSQSSLANAGTSKIDDSQPSWIHKESSGSRNRWVKPKRNPFSTSSFEGLPYSAPWQPAPPLHVQQEPASWNGWLPSPFGTPSWKSDPTGAAVINPLPTMTPPPPNISSGAYHPFTGWNVPGSNKPTYPPSYFTQSNFAATAAAGFPYFQDSSVVLDQGIAAEISVPPDLAASHQQDNTEVLIVKRLESFKQFDTVEDHSDHHYTSKPHSQPSKGWVKKIQDEWRILEKDLPDTIFVRVYETRMDLLRAVIVGADGTPYHDGIFFFDIHFPSTYPSVPPLVYYHSGGLRLNPNLYGCGKVCLSLLNTWSGRGNEKWVPRVSTILQVLVSIQGLILNAKPYFNEPGYAGMEGSPAGEKQSEAYNETTFLLSLKTMLYSMRRPPKYFEDFAFGHFYKHAHEILTACKAYLDGAQVGTLVKGGIQDVDAGDKSCANSFKMNLPVYINSLVKAFANIGVKDCEKYSVPVNNNNPVAATPSSSSIVNKVWSSSNYKKAALKVKHKM